MNIKQKLKAIQCYKSEIRKYPHPRSLKGIEVFSKFRGMAAGLKNAEAYNIKKNKIMKVGFRVDGSKRHWNEAHFKVFKYYEKFKKINVSSYLFQKDFQDDYLNSIKSRGFKIFAIKKLIYNETQNLL